MENINTRALRAIAQNQQQSSSKIIWKQQKSNILESRESKENNSPNNSRKIADTKSKKKVNSPSYKDHAINTSFFCKGDTILTLLHDAVHNGNLYAVERLIKGGADIYAKDKDGRTPLQLAKRLKVSDGGRVYRKIIALLKKHATDKEDPSINTMEDTLSIEDSFTNITEDLLAIEDLITNINAESRGELELNPTIELSILDTSSSTINKQSKKTSTTKKVIYTIMIASPFIATGIYTVVTISAGVIEFNPIVAAGIFVGVATLAAICFAIVKAYDKFNEEKSKGVDLCIASNGEVAPECLKSSEAAIS